MADDQGQSVERFLAGELARGDAMIATARPVLRHLLATDGFSLFNDQIVASLRGMLDHVAWQLLTAQAKAAGVADERQFAAERKDILAGAFCEDPAFLSFAHSQALEAQLAARLQNRNAIDPVLSPLLQELVASGDPATADLAMTFLAAQARFIQRQRRMELPLRELPGDLFHRALLVLMTQAGDHPDAAENVAQTLRQAFEESQGRLGLISRLVMAMGRQAARALSIEHAGLAIFATALSMASEQDRELSIMSLIDRRSARLMLALRSAGLKTAAVEEQLLYFKPDSVLPDGFDALQSDRAASLLAGSNPVPAF